MNTVLDTTLHYKNVFLKMIQNKKDEDTNDK
ncbi:Uncharacterised protein [Staphylococcus saccharolyticus]|uniref:Uncharacterized protein n=1 Tax=Staphylococcus saccharolyticus TaxID=33028 RepID=A0A380HAE0_9STAP|nr:Uncharacterised protein [Staphylococcus saccharolyticus]